MGMAGCRGDPGNQACNTRAINMARHATCDSHVSQGKEKDMMQSALEEPKGATEWGFG